MKKIIWFSRHEVTPRQLKELQRLFGGDVTVVEDGEVFDNAAVITRRFRHSGGDEMVVVAPLSVIAALCSEGLRPLRSEMELCSQNHHEMEVAMRRRDGRTDYFRFVKFTRVIRVDLVVEEIEPVAT